MTKKVENKPEQVSIDNLISVVVITYNSEKTIIDTLESIRKQTYPYIEIVISDDFSTDRTVEIVREWIGTSNSYHMTNIVCSSRNTGIPANCNRGISKARGMWIKILAGDDLLREDALETFHKYAVDSDDKCIYQSKVLFFGSNNELLNKYARKSYSLIKQQDQLFYLLEGNFLLAPAVGLYHRTIFDKIGLFDERFKLIEDYPFYLMLLDNGYYFRLINEELVKYRISSNSVSSRKKNIKQARESRLCDLRLFFLVRFKLLIKYKRYKLAFQQLFRFIRSSIVYLLYLDKVL